MPNDTVAHSDKTPEQIDFEFRREGLNKDLKPLLEKYRIDIHGVLKYTPHAIIPGVAYVDMKDHYEHTEKKD